MTVAYDSEIEATIDAAIASAEAGSLDIAVKQFSLARTQALHLADPEELAKKIASDHAAYVRERNQFRALFPAKPAGTRNVLIMSDSLGLPRPDDIEGEAQTYTNLINERYPDLNVTSLCQRFATTQNVRDELTADPDLGRDSHFVLHVGLNDCANRMFLENERIALSFLKPMTRDKLIDFTRKYRRDIIQRLPPHHYVNPTEFRQNLDAIIDLLRARNADKIVLTTIILPPAKSWPGTPGINRNFAAYNLEILNAVHDRDALLLDLDRHVWQAQKQGVLDPDGMHLADKGHQLFCNKCDPYLR